MEAFKVLGGVKLKKENTGLTEYSCHLLVCLLEIKFPIGSIIFRLWNSVIWIFDVKFQQFGCLTFNYYELVGIWPANNLKW